MKIGIIGQGYVGTAIKIGFKEHYDIETYDKFDLAKSTRSTIKDIVDRTDIIFVCVPTPMRKDGTCYTGIVEEVIREINETADGQIIVIKSTVPPGTTDRINQEYTRSTVIFNPEFLTEANFLEDFKNQSRIILGGDRKGTNKLRQVYSKVFPHATIVKTGSKTAEMVKYFINCFLATKVSFANEMYSVCEQVGIDYDKVVEYATYDERLGKSHWAVPGPDEDFGFGGHCLPKDLSAIVNEFKTYGLLESVEQVNDQVRENRDWEHMVGRAVLEEE
jgi:nucleotide sugar dehydrogenase|tara:strand:- start:387 stop:1214 length:828 start_codon:yes stop_codon:yes gene_type:complete